MNTAALTVAGIDAATESPAGGIVVADDYGTPTGCLHESAIDLVSAHVPEATDAEVHAGLLAGQNYLNSLGVTAWMDAIVGDYGGHRDPYDTYVHAASSEELHSEVVGSLWWPREVRDIDAEVAELTARARSEGRFRATSVKFMLDGIVESRTAAMNTEYTCTCGGFGTSYFTREHLEASFAALDAAGFDIHCHAIGDAAVRAALDAFAAIASPRAEARHHIAHVQVVDPVDVPRFAQLGITANLQALWACYDEQMIDLNIPILGEERTGWLYPFGSFASAGTHLAMGSDWPVSTANPWEAIHVAVNRSHPHRRGHLAPAARGGPRRGDGAAGLHLRVGPPAALTDQWRHPPRRAGEPRPGEREPLRSPGRRNRAHHERSDHQQRPPRPRRPVIADRAADIAAARNDQLRFRLRRKAIMTSTATAESTPDTGLDHLEIQGVKKVFGENTAIARLDLSVRRGEFLSLLGPSGCGKTTLLRMIAGFEHPTNGHIYLDGKDIVGLPPHRRPVNTVFQSYLLFPHMNIADNIAYGLKQAKVPKPEIAQRVRDVLALVQMEDFAGRKPEQLSGGQQQRIALARALVNRPQVLLLDEPMSALDRKLREEMQLELKRLHTKLDTTFVFVTHDQDEALAMSDRIVVMYDGVIQQIGSGEDIYANPHNGFVAGFIGKQNFIPAEVTSTDGGTAQMVSANSTVMETPSLDLRPASAAGEAGTLSVGDRVRAAIRPERMRVAPAGEETGRPNTARGKVISTSFLGDVIQYMIVVGDNDELLARVPAAGNELLAADAEVDLSWDADAVAVYGFEGGA